MDKKRFLYSIRYMGKLIISSDDNLIIQPFIIGKLLYEMKKNNFEKTAYFNNNYDAVLCSIINEMTLDSQGTVIILLYAYLVIPYEKLKSQLNNEYNRLNTEIKKCIDVKEFKLNNNYNDNDYLRHIRNSVAHVKFLFEEHKSITFIDEDIKFKKNFELIIPLNYIHLFLLRLENIVINYFNNNREKVDND